MSGIAKAPDPKLMRSIVRSQQCGTAIARANAEQAAERGRLAAQLAALDAEETADISRRGRADTEAQLVLARARVRELELQLGSAIAANVGASFAFHARREEIQRRLRETASPLIGSFVHDMGIEADNARQLRVKTERGAGKRTLRDNAAAIVFRLHAIRCAILAAEKLYYEADQAHVAAKLDALRTGLPTTETLRTPLRTHAAAMLADLNHGMAVDEALRKHCG